MNSSTTLLFAPIEPQENISSPRLYPTNPFIEFKREEIEQSIPARFDEIVQKYPQRIALKTKTVQFTYAELNGAANRIAHAIIAACGEEQAPVVLLLKDRAKAIIAMLGTFKAHKIFVPLDPAMPPPSIVQIIQDVQAALVVTDGTTHELVEQISSPALRVMSLDNLDANLSTENPTLCISPDSIAHIFYTSGSTGQPKGVYQNHRNTLATVSDTTNQLHIAAADRLVLLSPVTGSSALGNTILPALLNGSALLPYDIEQDGLGALADWLAREEITIYQSVPSLFRQFASSLKADENFPKLRLIRLGADRIDKKDIDLYKTHFCDDCLFRIGFGSTEADGIAAYLIGKQTPITSNIVPVGYPLQDLQVLLMDETGREVGMDTVGEIVVKGRYLPLGYWRNPELTAQVYSFDPVDPSLRICRTGDLGRRRADGLLELVGRKDFQVKIRGRRVQIDEIEMALSEIAGIKEAAVMAHKAAFDEMQLAAYVVPNPDVTLTIAEIREALKKRFADYMIPSTFVYLDALPRNANGKIDRQALPAPSRARPALSTPFVAPQSELETQIAKVWCELLELDQVGIHDNFFDLGGDSLSAMMMILEIEKFAKLNVPPEYLQKPTIAVLAQFCNRTVLPSGATRTSFGRNLLPSDGDSSFAPSVPQRPLLRMTTRDELGKAKSFRNRLVRLATGKTLANNILRWAIQTQVKHLSYEQGLRWLAWIGQPKIASRLFREERQMFRRLTIELGNPSAATDDAFRVSVLGNMIWQSYCQTALNTPWLPDGAIAALHTAPDLFWRSFAKRVDEANPEERGRLFDFSGLEYLYHARKQQRGIILVTYHSPAITIANAILARYTRLGFIPMISEEAAEQMAEREPNGSKSAWAARFALEGQRRLKQGGVVQIVNDVSYDEKKSIRKWIGGRAYHLKTGFAELALTTGASILPVYYSFDALGRAHMTVLPAFELADASDHGACVNDLLDQFVAFVEKAWRNYPESVGWGALRRYFSRPPAE